MGLGKILKVTKSTFEQVVMHAIQKNGYKVHFSYTKDYYYITGDEQALDQLSLSLS